MNGFRAAGLLLAGLLSLPSPVLATDPVYPVLREPFHRVVFRNGAVSVYSVRMAPGEQSFYHIHAQDQLAVVMLSSSSASQIQGQPEKVNPSERGSMAYIPHSVTGPYTHRVRALPGQPFWVMGIELSRGGGPGAGPGFAPAAAGMLAFPQGRLERIEIAPGGQRDISGSLLLAMMPGALELDAKRWAFSEGEVRWIGDGKGRHVVNRSPAPLTLIVLSLKP